MNLSNEQKAALTAAGIDLSKIDWNKVLLLLQAIISIFGQQPKPVMQHTPDHPGQECDHAACCAATLHSALQTADLALCHYQACCCEPPPAP